jgi:hypothetical protein
MKLSPKKRRDIIMFLITTAVGQFNNPLGIALEVCFLIWQLRKDDNENE